MMDLNSSENEISINKPSASSAKQKLIKLSFNENKIFVPRDQLLIVPKPEDEEYLAGDLIWVKTKGFPWWPCMITVDPETGNYSKNIIVRNKEIKTFHVQYFGSKACRGYTEGNIMVYEGKAKYDLKLDSIKNTPTPNKGQRKIELSNLSIKPSFKKDWNIAGDEADNAMTLSRELRIRNLTFEYILDKPLKTISKRQSQEFNQQKSQINSSQTPKTKKRKNENQTSTQKRKREKKSQSSIKSSPADVYDFNEFEDDFIDDTPTKFELSSAKRAKGEFSVYVQKVKNDIVKENPELTDEEIDEKLKHNWELMSDDMRNVYAPRTSLFLNTSFQLESPKKETDNSLNLSSNSLSRNSLPDLNFDSTNADVSLTEKKKSRKTKDESTLDINKENSIKFSKRKIIKLEHNKSSPKRNSEENKRSSSKTSTIKSNSIKSEVNIAQFLSSEGNVASEDSVSCSSENDGSDQKEMENNIERYCGKCYQNDKDLVRCDGQCSQYYHKDCLSKLSKTDSSKKCEECFTGKFKCFICKEHTEDVSLCSEKKCGKFYHLKCLSLNFPHKVINVDQNKFKCPLHFCLTCHNEHLEDNIVRTVKKKLTTCLKCPTAYHVLDACIAAGSISIDSNHIICPEHHDKKSLKHVNVSWCFSCNFGGNLICCEKCPTAFHQECLLEEGGKLPDEGSYFCNDCVARKQLHYGDIVWVKLSSYRWWPAKLKHPTNVPDNILNIKHSDGDFPVFFFGSHDYYWINRSKAFLYMEGDDKRKISNAANRNLDKVFKKAMEEVIVEYETWQESKKTVMQLKTNIPPPYYHLKINKPYGKCQQAYVDLDKSHNQACECTDADPCGSDDCLNRVLMYECDTVICKNKEKCKNQRFKKREYAKTEPFKTQAGWGLKTLEDIKKGQFVIEYVGELVDEEECNKRLNDMALRNDKNFYFLTIDKETIIDAGPKGNLARFMNHSCDPNCETQKWVVNNQVRVGLFAKTDIPAGSELTFNYNLESRGNEKSKCLCNSKNCSGYIGIRPNKIVEDKQKQKDVKKKKNKPDYASIHEDECFRCGEVGKLIMCDQKNCPKSYHLSCLKLEKIPHGKWNCPWHHCDECGKKSVMFCNYCPTSYCSEHEKVELNKLQNGDLICTDHNSAYLQKVKKLANKNIENNPVSVTEEEQLNNSQNNKTAKRVRKSIADQKEEVAEKRKRDEERRRKNIESRMNRMNRRNSQGNQLDNSTCILNNDKEILDNDIKDENNIKEKENFEKSFQSTKIIEEENNLTEKEKNEESLPTEKNLDSDDLKIVESEIETNNNENDIRQKNSNNSDSNIENNEESLNPTSNNLVPDQVNPTDLNSVETLKDNLDQEKNKKMLNNDENKNDNLKQQVNLN